MANESSAQRSQRIANMMSRYDEANERVGQSDSNRARKQRREIVKNKILAEGVDRLQAAAVMHQR